MSHKTYIITCDVRGESQMSYEYLGQAYGREYTTRDEAEREAANLRLTAEQYGLDADTTYSVTEA